MKILVVEDEKKTAGYLKKGLGENGYATEVATDGELGLARAMQEKFDLVILDINLPLRDGLSVLNELRSAGRETPVLILTARDAVPERVKGLNLGADDYLVKPFAFSELLARVRTILRRGPQRKPEILRIADLQLDLPRRRALRGGRNIDLSPKEFSLLWFMAEHQGEVLSRTLLAEQIWDVNFASETNVIDVAVRRLRAKVDDPFESKLIETVRGVGYRLSAGEGK